MGKPVYIAPSRRSLPILSALIALMLFMGQLGAYATLADNATQDTVNQEDQEQPAITLKAPQVAPASSIAILPLLFRAEWEISLPQVAPVYSEKKTIPFSGTYHFRTRFRQFISPNAP